VVEESYWDMVGMVEVGVRVVDWRNVDSKRGRERLRSGLTGDPPIKVRRPRSANHGDARAK
jgi:hypothetical protein